MFKEVQALQSFVYPSVIHILLPCICSPSHTTPKESWQVEKTPKPSAQRLVFCKGLEAGLQNAEADPLATRAMKVEPLLDSNTNRSRGRPAQTMVQKVLIKAVETCSAPGGVTKEPPAWLSLPRAYLGDIAEIMHANENITDTET